MLGIIYCHCYIPNKAYYYKSTLHYMVSGMDPPQKLNLRNAKDASKAWKNFKQLWEVYEVASGTNEKPQLVDLPSKMQMTSRILRKLLKNLIKIVRLLLIYWRKDMHSSIEGRGWRRPTINM